MNIYIYKNNTLIAGVPAPSLEEFNANPTKFYPPMPEGLFVASTTYYTYPIVEGNTVRNKTREERILLDNETILLNQGEYVESNQIKFKACPNDLYKSLWVTPNWIEGATLEEAQLIKRNELKSQRDLSTIQDYEYNGVLYQADLISQDNFFQSLMLNETNINWIASDNSVHNLVYDDFVAIVDGIKERKKQSFIKFNGLYEQVLTCNNVEEVKLVIWN